MSEDDELLVTKNSVPLLVSQELLEDSQVNLMSWLQNPHLYRPTVPKVLSRREKFRDALMNRRMRLGEWVFKKITGEDPYDVYWRED